MLIDSIELVSMNDCLRIMCFPANPKASISALIAKVCRLLDKHVYEKARCYRADAEDRTKHILLELDLIFAILSDQEFEESLRAKQFDCSILTKQFYNLERICCCSSKKFKKALTSSESFSDFVKAGPVVLNSFHKMKTQLSRIVCLDIEAFEFDHNKILEFGLVVYNLQNRSEEAHHIIVADYGHLYNGKYVCNNKEKFNFGSSQRLKLSVAIDFIVRHLSQPASCLLGHNIKSDINFLRQSTSHNITLPVFDTQAIFKYHTLSQESASLARVLDDLEIPYSNLHNAGNDAYYTLKAFIKLAQLDQ